MDYYLLEKCKIVYIFKIKNVKVVDYDLRVLF
jgi:hypothetical protein